LIVFAFVNKYITIEKGVYTISIKKYYENEQEIFLTP